MHPIGELEARQKTGDHSDHGGERVVVSWWPRWDSIDDTARWSQIYFWIGIVALFVLGASEVLSHRYGNRKDELVAASEKRLADDRAAKDKQHEDDVAKQRKEADARVAEVSSHAEQANNALKEERDARMQLEARLAPRALTPEQHADLVARLRRIEGHKIKILISPDPESTTIGNVISKALIAAGWDVGGMIGTSYTRSITGMLVEVVPGADESTVVAARGLAEALRAQGLAAMGPAPLQLGNFLGTPFGSAEGAAIQLTIGNK
jgi:hypothetical protein